MFYLLKQVHIFFFQVLNCVLVLVWLVGFVSIQLFDGDVIEAVHNLPASLLLRLKLSLFVEVSLTNARLHVGLIVRVELQIRCCLRMLDERGLLSHLE